MGMFHIKKRRYLIKCIRTDIIVIVNVYINLVLTSYLHYYLYDNFKRLKFELPTKKNIVRTYVVGITYNHSRKAKTISNLITYMGHGHTNKNFGCRKPKQIVNSTDD